MRWFSILAGLVFIPVVLAGQQAGGGNTVTPDEAGKLARGQDVTVEMVVKSVGISKNKEHWFLNSQADWKDDKNFYVLIPKSVVEKLKAKDITDPEKAFPGKTIQVTGNVTIHFTTPQIILRSPDRLKVVK